MNSKKQALIRSIVGDIRFRGLKPGDKIPSRNYWVQHYGVSYDTVDRALRDMIEAGILSAERGRGTFISEHSLVKNSVKRIYAVFHFLGYFNGTIEQIFSKGPGSDVPVYNIRDYDADMYMPEFLKKGSGIIWYYPRPFRLGMIDTIQRAGIPILLLNRDYDGYNCIATDPKASLREGLEWLCRNAGPDVALIYGPSGHIAPYREKRIIAAYELIAEMHLHLDSRNIFHTEHRPTIEEAYRIANSLFHQKTMPRALILLDVELALLLVSAGLSFGKIPGRDYCLLTFDFVQQLMEYRGIGMMDQKLQSFCDDAKDFFFPEKERTGLFRKFIKTELLYRKD